MISMLRCQLRDYVNAIQFELIPAHVQINYQALKCQRWKDAV